jgi:hypothetical protein
MISIDSDRRDRRDRRQARHGKEDKKGKQVVSKGGRKAGLDVKLKLTQRTDH